MTRIDLTQSPQELVLALAPILATAQFVGLLAPADDELGYVLLDEGEWPVEVQAADVVVTAFRRELSDTEFAELIISRLMELV